MVTAQPICAFVFAYAKSQFSHDMANFVFEVSHILDIELNNVDMHKQYYYDIEPQFYYIRSYKHGFLGVLDYLGALI